MRYLPLSDPDRTAMLARIGAKDIDALFADIPADKLLTAPVDLPRRKGELEVERLLGPAAQNGPLGVARLRLVDLGERGRDRPVADVGNPRVGDVLTENDRFAGH